MSDDPLRIAYEATEFWVDDAPCGPFYLRCGVQSPKLDRLLAHAGLNEWVYITACNPDSRPLSDKENETRMQKLEARLHAQSCLFYHGRGVPTVGDWPPEPSLLVLGLHETDGLKIGAAFGQRAIVVGTRGEPARLAWAVSAPGE